MSCGNCERPIEKGAGASRFHVFALALVAQVGAACAASGTPEPKTAVAALAQAVERRDAKTVHASLDEQSRVRVTVAEVQALLDRDAKEIHKRLTAASGLESDVRAEVVLPGGEQVALAHDSGEFLVAETSGLAGVAVTPQEALVGLRSALEHPDYGALLQLLSSDVRQVVESQRQALVQALADVDVMQITILGDRAVVNTADGHRVELELESGVWRVRDFE